MSCKGMSQDHCCYLNGKVCKYLKENSAGRRWSCGLFEQYGSWENVYLSQEYQTDLVPEWITYCATFDKPYTRCGDWPTQGEVCTVCGEVGE